MQHEPELFSKSGEHVATMGFDDSYGLCQTVVHQEKVDFCLPKELAFTVWCEEFDSETWFRRSTSGGPFDASVMPRRECPAVTFRGKLNHIWG
jgi:hypothetical protein